MTLFTYLTLRSECPQCGKDEIAHYLNLTIGDEVECWNCGTEPRVTTVRTIHVNDEDRPIPDR